MEPEICWSPQQISGWEGVSVVELGSMVLMVPAALLTPAGSGGAGGGVVSAGSLGQLTPSVIFVRSVLCFD